MTNAKTNTNAKAHLDGKVTHNGQTFTASAAFAQMEAVHDRMWLLQEQQLDCYKEIGLLVIQLRPLYKSDKLFGQAMAQHTTISRQDYNDCKKIAENWELVQRLNTDGKLDGLGMSAIRKRITKASKPAEPKAPKSAGNTSAGKAKAKPEAATDGPSDTKQFQTEAELATFVKAALESNGLNTSAFLKALHAEIVG